MFAHWSCGHNHQEDIDGRTPLCSPKPAWFLLEVGAGSHGYRTRRGLRRGDYTLHILNPIDGTYSPAWALSDVAPLRVADRQDRRLMIRCDDGWRPVMP